MVDLKKLFGLDTTVGEGDFIELDTSNIETPTGKVPIRVDKLNDFSDTDRILKAVRNNAVVFVKIKPLKEKDLSELKRAIDKLRKTCVAINGDIAGIDENFIVVCPQFCHIMRE